MGGAGLFFQALSIAQSNRTTTYARTDMNPLNTVRGALITGFILALIVAVAIQPAAFAELGLVVWIHILSGVMWIRWAAVATWLTGVWYLVRANNFGNAVSFGRLGQDHYGLVIGIGGWLGTIMLFNVWRSEEHTSE